MAGVWFTPFDPIEVNQNAITHTADYFSPARTGIVSESDRTGFTRDPVADIHPVKYEHGSYA